MSPNMNMKYVAALSCKILISGNLKRYCD